MAAIRESREPGERDAAAMEALASQIARMRDARRRVDDEGLIVLGARDQPMPHPALTIERSASAEIRALRASLGLSVSAPARAQGRPVGAASAPDRLASPKLKLAR